MRYYKQIDNGYILAIGTGNGGEEIAVEEYGKIIAVISEKPAATGNTDYRLREDLTWEGYEVEPDSDPEPMDTDKAEAYDILMGVSE